jgi:DNA invertase Pin-like site-specific DNA recombinase
LTDAGVSAFRGQHAAKGALGQFLAAVESGSITRGSTLIVESLDRLSRENVLAAFDQLSALIRAGISVVTLQDSQRYSSESITENWSRLIISLTVMARAHDESQRKSQRLAAAWGEKKRKAAHGLAMTRRCVAWCVPTEGRYVLVEERAKVVRKIYQMSSNGIGQAAIATRLNRDDVASWGNAASGWQPSYIKKILANRATIGAYQPCKVLDGRRTHDGEEIPNYYPAVVSEDLFWRVQAGLAERKVGRGGRRGKRFSNILRLIARCGCGRRMVYVDKGQPPKGGSYLVCDGLRRGLGCDTKSGWWRYSRAETAVLSGLRHLDIGVVTARGDAPSDDKQRIAHLRSQLATQTARRDRLIDALGDVEDLAVVEKVRASAATVAELSAALIAAEQEVAQVTAIGPIEDNLRRIEMLTVVMAGLSEDDLFDARARLSQEISRVLHKLTFTADNILADYRAPQNPRFRNPFLWLHHVPLIVRKEEDEDCHDDLDLAEILETAPRRIPNL